MNHRLTKYLPIVVLLVVALIYASQFVPRVTYPRLRLNDSVYQVTAKAVAQAFGFCLTNDPDCPISPCGPTGYSASMLPVAKCTSEPRR